jgi:hypothetical protein
LELLVVLVLVLLPSWYLVSCLGEKDIHTHAHNAFIEHNHTSHHTLNWFGGVAFASLLLVMKLAGHIQVSYTCEQTGEL